MSVTLLDSGAMRSSPSEAASIIMSCERVCTAKRLAAFSSALRSGCLVGLLESSVPTMALPLAQASGRQTQTDTLVFGWPVWRAATHFWTLGLRTVIRVPGFSGVGSLRLASWPVVLHPANA